MPRSFDNIERDLLPALQQTLEIADRADFCVGYFNLRGWKQPDRFIEGMKHHGEPVPEPKIEAGTVNVAI